MLKPVDINDTINTREIKEQPKAKIKKISEPEPPMPTGGKSRFEEIENAIKALADAVIDISETLSVKPYTIKALNEAVTTLNRRV